MVQKRQEKMYIYGKIILEIMNLYQQLEELGGEGGELFSKHTFINGNQGTNANVATTTSGSGIKRATAGGGRRRNRSSKR